jgi:tryptophan synthase alpha chain
MSAVDRWFSDLRREGKKALLPFLTAGDPDLPFTERLLVELDRRGPWMCEVGFPYSDPIADGPVIQASYTRALERRVRLAEILAAIGRTTLGRTAPVVGMVSYAIVHRTGIERFVSEAQSAGLAGLIVPDLLVEESGPLATVCRERDMSLIQLVTPTTPRERAVRIAEASTGFLYYVSVTGITGERAALPADLAENVEWIRRRTALPICIGFGISRPEHVRALAPVADGLIVGSAIVRRIAESKGRPVEEAVKEIAEFLAGLALEMESMSKLPEVSGNG